MNSEEQVREAQRLWLLVKSAELELSAAKLQRDGRYAALLAHQLAYQLPQFRDQQAQEARISPKIAIRVDKF